mmetsp:Transcript_10813/g.20968  ORF Transcript_10813/g.20968 Transcript_10813/m.20968 type:complete len:263 (+) Transcript_10813:481-1269(+)
MNARLEPSGSISPARKVRHLLAQPERRCVPLWRPDWVVDHQPTALHERVADFGADKFEPTLLERLGHLDGSRVLRRHLAEARPAVELGAAANVAPQVLVEVSVLRARNPRFLSLLNECKYAACIMLDARDFATMPDNRIFFQRICNWLQQPLYVSISHCRAGCNVEVVERSAVGLAFCEDSRPTESSLSPFQTKFLEKRLVASLLPTPFITHVRFVFVAHPPTEGSFIPARRSRKHMRRCPRSVQGNASSSKHIGRSPLPRF